MTKENIIRVCAELDGFKLLKSDVNPMWDSWLWHGELFSDKVLPKYSTRYDAIIPLVVKWCSKHGWKAFAEQLTGSRVYDAVCVETEIISVLSKTPTEIATALVQAAGMWKE